jgi:ArsR family transcriptional regulator, arsenate/arsenite/antimonite-responsive transcriptional repressor
MGRSKNTSFGKRENRLADLARGLAHPARIAILEFLARKSTCMCGAIVDQIPLSQATVSQHLAELKRIGLIRGEIEGPRVCYCIDRKSWNEAREILTEFLAEPTNCC